MHVLHLEVMVLRLGAPPRCSADAALCCGGQDEILYMGFDGTKIGLPKDFVLTDYSKVRARSPPAAAAAATISM